jgi:hypothetical protein
MYEIYLQRSYADQWVDTGTFTTESRYFDLAKNDTYSAPLKDGVRAYYFSAERMLKEYYKGGSGSWRETIHSIAMTCHSPRQVIEALKEEFLVDTTFKDNYWEELELWVFKIIDAEDMYGLDSSQLRFRVMEVPQ